jgi:hypothetical protein
MSLPRFEHKYRVDERTAFAVRDYIASYLEPDRHVLDAKNNSYPVNNVYLDSEDLETYWTAINGSKDRYKLRLRTYGEATGLPVYCEVKRRLNDQILKSRGAVLPSAVDSVLAGNFPTDDQMATTDISEFRAVVTFVELIRKIDARPKALVSYVREAWVSPDSDFIRLTMDRQVRVAPTSTSSLAWNESLEPTIPFGDDVVLEIKITGNAPFWFTDLEQAAGLHRGTAAKYCDGVLARGEREFSAGYEAPCQLEALQAIENRRRRLEINAASYREADQKIA